MSTNGGDRKYMSGAEFRKEREKWCKDRQVFARVAGVPVRTIAAFELGTTSRPRQYDTLVDVLARYRRGEINDKTPMPAGDSEPDEVDLIPGMSATIRAADYVSLGEYRRVREALERVAKELRR